MLCQQLGREEVRVGSVELTREETQFHLQLTLDLQNFEHLGGSRSDEDLYGVSPFIIMSTDDEDLSDGEIDRSLRDVLTNSLIPESDIERQLTTLSRKVKIMMINGAKEKSKENLEHGLRDDLLDGKSRNLISMLMRSSVPGTPNFTPTFPSMIFS